MRVLVADPDRDIREMVEDLLEGEGLEVRHAGNLDEALLALRDELFDVWLCHLPLLRDGEGCLRRRVRDLHPRAWVVAMSAAGALAGSDEADTNLAKPFTRAQLLAALTRGGRRGGPGC